MKKHWIFLLFLLVGCKSLVQEANPQIEQDEPIISGKTANYNFDKGIIEFYGDASFKTDIFEVKNADTLVYNDKTKELVAYGFKAFSLYNGVVEMKGGQGILKYTVGEKIAYME